MSAELSDETPASVGAAKPIAPHQPLIFGHRGAAGLVPENTLPGFAKAVELGVDGIELDVHAAHDRLWVIHDATLDRTTSRTGPLADHSVAQLLATDAGNGAQIPQLDAVLAMLPDTVQLNVELKGADTALPVLQATRDWPAERLLVSSFDHAQLRTYRSLGGHARVGVLLDRWQKDVLEVAAELSAWSINLSRRVVTQARMHHLHKSGLRVLVYTVNRLSTARRLADWGVDGLFTDRPDRVSRAALAD